MGQKEEQASDNNRVTVTLCYRVWEKYHSDGRAEKRAASLMNLLDVKTDYDANRRIARLPLTGTF